MFAPKIHQPKTHDIIPSHQPKQKKANNSFGWPSSWREECQSNSWNTSTDWSNFLPVSSGFSPVTTGQAAAPVQRFSEEKMFAPEPEPQSSISAIAQQGVQGHGQPLPYYQQVQAAFGNQDLSQIETYTGPVAQSAAEALHAGAYTTGRLPLPRKTLICIR